jgi:hypothetical protein
LFADRYHARALKTPRACSFAVRYVLLNARKHARTSPALGGSNAGPDGFVDPCSSAAWFDGFARPRPLVFGAVQCRADFERSVGLQAPVVAPRVWLLRSGLRRSVPFDVDAAPAGVG